MSVKTVDQLTKSEKEWYMQMFEEYNTEKDGVHSEVRSFSNFVVYMQTGDREVYLKIRPCCPEYMEIN